MFGLFKERPRKTAIRIRKIYNGVEMKPQVIAAPPEITAKSITDIKEHPKRYLSELKIQDSLLGWPTIEITDLTVPEHLEEHDVDVICEVLYTYKHIGPIQKSPLPGILFWLLLWGAIVTFGMVFWLSQQAKQVRIDSQCYYYLKNGTPSSIIIEGEEYKLNPNGSLDRTDRMFLNPYHEERLRGMTDEDCTFINTR